MNIRPRPFKGQPPSKCSRWKLTWQLPLQADGSRPRESHTFVGTRRSAEIEWARRQAEITSSPMRVVRPGAITVGEYLDAWMKRTAPRWSEKTKDSYARMARLHILPALGATPLSKLTRAQIADWLSALAAKPSARGGRLADRTVSYCRSILRVCLHEAVRDGLLAGSPVDLVRGPVSRSKVIASYTLDEVRRLDVADSRFRVGPLLAVLWRSGLRIGEAVALRWSDLDLDKGVLFVSRQIVEVGGRKMETRPKTARGVREIPLSGEAATILRNHRATQAVEAQMRGKGWNSMGLVFPSEAGGWMGQRNVLRAWYVALAEVGLKQGGVHALRHTFASLALLAGMDITTLSTILGHESPAFTARTYVHVLGPTKRQAMGLFDQLLESAPGRRPLP